jgi:hypothetical protein
MFTAKTERIDRDKVLKEKLYYSSLFTHSHIAFYNELNA